MLLTKMLLIDDFKIDARNRPTERNTVRDGPLTAVSRSAMFTQDHPTTYKNNSMSVSYTLLNKSSQRKA